MNWHGGPNYLNKHLFPHPKWGSTWKLALIGPVISVEMMFENVDKDEVLVTLDQGQRMTMTSGTCVFSFGLQFISKFTVAHTNCLGLNSEWQALIIPNH